MSYSQFAFASSNPSSTAFQHSPQQVGPPKFWVSVLSDSKMHFCCLQVLVRVPLIASRMGSKWATTTLGNFAHFCYQTNMAKIGNLRISKAINFALNKTSPNGESTRKMAAFLLQI